MERLIFVCPTTGRDVDVGIETEIGTLLRIRQKTLQTHCAVCGERHEWKVCDAVLPQAA
jgi:hypothetical protein